MNAIKKFWNDETAAASLEYAMLWGIVGVTALAGCTILANRLAAIIQNSANALEHIPNG